MHVGIGSSVRTPILEFALARDVEFKLLPPTGTSLVRGGEERMASDFQRSAHFGATVLDFLHILIFSLVRKFLAVGLKCTGSL